jgi:hypothetical protein
MEDEALIEEVRTLNQKLRTLCYMMWSLLALQCIRPKTDRPGQPPPVLDLRTQEGQEIARSAFLGADALVRFATKEFPGSGQDVPPWVM